MTATPGVVARHPFGSRVELLAHGGVEHHVELHVVPNGASRARHSGNKGKHREQRPDRECDLDHGSEGASRTACDAAHADLRGPRQETEPAERTLEQARSTRGRRVLQRLADRDPDAATYGDQRRQRRREQADDDAGGDDAADDAERRRDREVASSEEAHDRIRDQQPEADAEDGAGGAQEQGRAVVDAPDLPACPADRLHDTDLVALLSDERRHRVRDQHQRREKRKHRKHVHQRRHLPEELLARVVARRANAREVAQPGELGVRAEVSLDMRDGCCDRGVSVVANAQLQLAEAGLPAQPSDSRGGGVENDRVGLAAHLPADEVATVPEIRTVSSRPPAPTIRSVSPGRPSYRLCFAF